MILKWTDRGTFSVPRQMVRRREILNMLGSVNVQVARLIESLCEQTGHIPVMMKGGALPEKDSSEGSQATRVAGVSIVAGDWPNTDAMQKAA